MYRIRFLWLILAMVLLACPHARGQVQEESVFAAAAWSDTDAWTNPHLATGQCGGGCQCHGISARNEAERNRDWLSAAFTYQVQPGRAVVNVRVNVQCKYANGQNGQIRVRVRFPNRPEIPEQIFDSAEFFSSDSTCRFVLPPPGSSGSPGRSIAMPLPGEWINNGDLINEMVVDVRRYGTGNGVRTLRVSAIRLTVETTAAQFTDCNGNGIPDEWEIDADPSLDCNGNGILDECEIALNPSLDCNGNGILDSCEIAQNPSLDCNNNGVLDSCEIAQNPSLDCNGNGILDSCEIAQNPSLDCNGNGVIDTCEIAQDPSRDCNGNGILDVCEIAQNPSLDCNGSGVIDACEIAQNPSLDCTGSGVLDICEIAQDPSLDCNNSGVPDACEIAQNPSLDCNNSGVLDECEWEAGEHVWGPAGSGVFGAASNWCPTGIGVPQAGDTAVLDLLSTYTITFNAPGASGLLDVRGGSPTLSLGGHTYTLSGVAGGRLLVGSSPGMAASLDVRQGLMQVLGNVDVGTVPGASGLLRIADLGAGFSASAVEIGRVGSGSLIVEGGASMASFSVAIGAASGGTGTARVEGSGSLLTAPLGLFVNRGELFVGAGARVSSSTGVFVGPDGTLTGDGTIEGPLSSIGSVRPGGVGTGTLLVQGSFTQIGVQPDIGEQAGSLNLRVAGKNDFDRLEVTGTATLGGGLFLELVDGFMPDTSFDAELVAAGSRSGRFDVAFFPGLEDGRFLRIAYDLAAAGRIALLVDTLTGDLEFDGSSFFAGRSPTWAALGDLNGNGFPDLAVTVPDDNDPEGLPGEVVVLYNGGVDNGEWQGFTSTAQFPVGRNPRGIAIADVSGVNGLDLVVANAGDNNLAVLTNDGSGVFIGQTLVPVGVEPVAVAALDFNGNGRADLAVANAGDDTVSLLTNLGFTIPGFSTSNVSVGRRPGSVDPWDPDNVKDVGVVVSNLEDSTVSVLVRDFGSGSFAVVATLDVGPSPVQVVTGDLNLNGLTDIVTSNAAGDTVSVLLYQGGTSFAPSVDLPVGAGPGALALVDVDGDGDLDIAVIATNGDGDRVVRILRNDLADGQLAFAPAADLFAGASPVFVLGGDVDGSGEHDLVVLSEDTTGSVEGPAGDWGRGLDSETAFVFRSAIEATCPADLAPPFGVLDIFDVLAFLTLFEAEDPAADFAPPFGVFDIFDVIEYLSLFEQGCP